MLLQAKELRHSVEAQRDLVGVARDQFAIDKDQIEFERKFNAEKEQPKLLLSTNGFSSSAPNLNFNLVLKNVGPTCTDIEVVANHELFHGKVLLKRNDLQKDESVGFQLQFPIERRRDEIPVHILYRDLSGFRHQMGFKVRVHDNHPYLDNKRGERLQTPHEPRTP